MGAALALASAVFYGAGDFFGGLTARRSTTTAAVLVSQFAGLVLLVAVLPLLPSASLDRHDLRWGAAAGLAGGVGVALLYRALAIGTMAVVAPITAVCAVAIPVVASVLYGERVSALAAIGIALAVVAIVLVSQEQQHESPGRLESPRAHHPLIPIAIAFVSGVAIGVFFLALARTGRAAGLWPIVAARTTSVVLFAILAVVRRTPVRMPRDTATLAVVGGALDMTANGLYLVATRYGVLSITATLASLYPASTIVLARLVLGERLSRWQQVGIACALLAIVLIVSGGSA